MKLDIGEAPSNWQAALVDPRFAAFALRATRR